MKIILIILFSIAISKASFGQLFQKSNQYYYIQVDCNTIPAKEQSKGYYEHEYEYYKNTFRKATIQRNCGISLTVLGLGLLTGSFIIAPPSYSNYYDDGNATASNVMGYLGSFFVIVGIPIWISGGVKRSNNKRVMEDMESKIDLSFGTTRNGMGLLLRF